MKSWAVPKGPSLDPAKKVLAIEVEYPTLEYNTLEAAIPEGNYGAGEVIVWDSGHWLPHGNPAEGIKKGKLSFELAGEKLAGGWSLVRFKHSKKENAQWLLMKKDDEYARTGSFDILQEAPESVLSGPGVEGRRLALKTIGRASR